MELFWEVAILSLPPGFAPESCPNRAFCVDQFRASSLLQMPPSAGQATSRRPYDVQSLQTFAAFNLDPWPGSRLDFGTEAILAYAIHARRESVLRRGLDVLLF